jgi:hypothetical protein
MFSALHFNDVRDQIGELILIRSRKLFRVPNLITLCKIDGVLMNDRKKDVRATRSTEFMVGTNTKVVVHIEIYLYIEYEQHNFYLL